MEDLSKTQLILLTLLVSFVTSIATGIATVSLLDQVPEPVAQTINRVIERTVERVVPSLTETGGRETVITKETTIVVKEEDLITEAIAKNRKSLVRIYRDRKKDTVLLSTTTPADDGFASLGVVVSRDGMIAADASRIAASGSYSARFEDGSAAPLSVISQDEIWGIALLKVTLDKVPPTSSPMAYQAVSFTDVASLKLGQTVIALSGEDRDAVSIGIISGFGQDTLHTAESGHSTTTSEAKAVISGITTNISSSGAAGQPIFNMFGELVAFSVSLEPGVYRDITANIVSAIVEAGDPRSTL